MRSVRIELAKLILVGTRVTYQATGDAEILNILFSYKVLVRDVSDVKSGGWHKLKKKDTQSA